MRRLIAGALLLACASPGMPPGGPPDTAAPQLLSINPDSGTVGVRPKEILFHFDEVVSERPQSVTSLSNLFLISPRNGAPTASWHRDVIGVRPGHGWQANTAYTIIMQKGLADIRGNVRNTGVTTFFSTGSTIPHTRISGTAFDWTSGTPAAGVMVEAFALPDSVHPYIAIADSNGSFLMEHMPPRTYTVRAYLDRNNNTGIDPSEAWDSASVAVTDSARLDLMIFVHDTIPPRIRDVRDVDSTTLAVTFDKPVDPGQTLSVSNFAVVGSDSVPLPIVSVGAAPKDSVRPVVPVVGAPPAARPPVAAAPPARPPVAAAPADTLVKPKPVMPKPVPLQEVQIKLQRTLIPTKAYRLRAIGIRGLLGHAGNSERVYTVPAPPPPPAVKLDTTRAPVPATTPTPPKP